MIELQNELEQRGIRVTPNRLLVARCLSESEFPLTIAEIESCIESVDKSSILRVLRLFLEKNIIHAVDDGGGSIRYELCHSRSCHTDDDTHLHFKCVVCNRIYCIENQPIPEIELPEGFTLLTANFVVKGICKTCSLKNAPHV